MHNTMYIYLVLGEKYLFWCFYFPGVSSDCKKWNCDVTLSPEELLHGYFKFYKSFDFQNKDVCLETGIIIPKKGYFENIITNPFSDGENPYEDIVATLPEDKVLYIQTCMGESLRVLDASPDSLILGNRSYQ
jgi:hypothetical protein